MNAKKTIVMCVALAACAGMRPASGQERVAGHWTGLLDHGGWVQPLAFDIDDAANVDGRAVRFETDRLLFVGQLEGSALVGTVSRKDTNAVEGKFFVTHDQMAYDPGSEPAFPYAR